MARSASSARSTRARSVSSQRSTAQSQGYSTPPTPPPPIASKYQAQAQNAKQAGGMTDGKRQEIFDGLITAVKLVDHAWPLQPFPVTKVLLNILTHFRDDAALGVKCQKSAELCTRLLEVLWTIDKQFNSHLPQPLAGFVGDFNDKLSSIEQVIDKYQRERHWWTRMVKTMGSLDSIAAMEADVKELLQYTHFTYSIYAKGLPDAAAVSQQQQTKGSEQARGRKRADPQHKRSKDDLLEDKRSLDELRRDALLSVDNKDKLRNAAFALSKRYEDAAEPDYFEAIFWYKFLAEHDSERSGATAMTAIGNILQYGKGDYMCNYVEAREYYEEAFRRHDHTAMTRIGRMYWEGKLSDGGHAQEYVAVECFHQALDRDSEHQIRGDVSALSLLGRMYETRAEALANTKSDADSALHQLEYLRDAENAYYEGVEKGNANCVIRLSKLYARLESMPNVIVDYHRKKKLMEAKNQLEHDNDPRILLDTALGVLNHTGLAVVQDLLEKALSMGHSLAACYLGKLEELSNNMRSAEDYFLRSAKAQCAEGMRCLGAFLLKHSKELVWHNERTEESNVKQALKWLQSAVRYGDGLSAFYLANFYLNKKTSDGRTEGVRWYREGIRLKNVQCMKWMAEFCMSPGFLQDPDYAVVLYKKAVQLGDPEAHVELARLHLEGLQDPAADRWLVPKDPSAARDMFERLAKLPEQDMQPLLRIAIYWHLGRLESPEYPKEGDEPLPDNKKVPAIKKAQTHLMLALKQLQAMDSKKQTKAVSSSSSSNNSAGKNNAAATSNGSNNSSTVKTVELSQPHHLLEDLSDSLMVDPSIIEWSYTKPKLTRRIVFELVMLVLSEAADDCVKIRERKRNLKAGAPISEEFIKSINAAWQKFRTATDLAYMGAVEYDCPQCMTVLGWLCGLEYRASAPLPDYATLLENHKGPHDKSHATWWGERPLQTARCNKPRLGDAGTCSTVSLSTYLTVRQEITDAAERIEKALRIKSGATMEQWNGVSFCYNIAANGRLLCADCEPTRTDRLTFPKIYFESCQHCNHQDSHECTRQLDDIPGSDNYDGDDEETRARNAVEAHKTWVNRADSDRAKFVREITELLSAPVPWRSERSPLEQTVFHLQADDAKVSDALCHVGSSKMMGSSGKDADNKDDAAAKTDNESDKETNDSDKETKEGDEEAKEAADDKGSDGEGDDAASDSDAVEKGISLTEHEEDQCGACWLAEPRLKTDRDFEATFRIRAGTNGSGADGMAFVVQSAGLDAIGEGGSGIGYSDIPSSVAVEFDSYCSPTNWRDPDGNHVSIQTRYTEPNSANHDYSLACTSKVPTLNSGDVLHFSVLYLADKRLLSVWIQEDEEDEWSPLMEATVDLTKLGAELWLGFTAATGGYAQTHQVLDFEVTVAK
ncbi:hypothetical protein RI367_005753 [Sorochytrium milnesiophthora]